MKHENVLGYKDSFWHGSKLYLVTELCYDGDLRSYINRHKERNELIAEEKVLLTFKQLC